MIIWMYNFDPFLYIDRAHFVPWSWLTSNSGWSISTPAISKGEKKSSVFKRLFDRSEASNLDVAEQNLVVHVWFLITLQNWLPIIADFNISKFGIGLPSTQSAWEFISEWCRNKSVIHKWALMSAVLHLCVRLCGGHKRDQAMANFSNWKSQKPHGSAAYSSSARSS